MVSDSGVSAAILGLLLPLFVNGRTLQTEAKYAFDYMNNKVYDFSDDVSILKHLTKGRSALKSPRQALITLEMESPPCPSRYSEGTSPSMNLYHIGDFKFSVPTQTGAGIRKRKVLAECGFLLGLTDFSEIEPFDSPESDANSSELWFRWSKLRAKCQISSVLDGLKEGTGEADVLVKPMYMLVRLPEAVPRPPEIEMTRVKEVTVNLHGLDTLPSESAKAMISNIEYRMACVVNSEIRNVLKDYMKSSISKQKPENLSKLIFDRRTL